MIMVGQTFRFKQFDVDQSQSGFRINTDGVLIGALAAGVHHDTLLDIGTGTGVIAMMLAQRYPGAMINAVDSDSASAKTAAINFGRSKFHRRLSALNTSFQDYSENNPGLRYDLIVSNPPFFINAIRSANSRVAAAKHTQLSFFHEFVSFAVKHLNPVGLAWLILPNDTAEVVIAYAYKAGLYVNHRFDITSFAEKSSHRIVFSLGFSDQDLGSERIVIYDTQKEYSQRFRKLLTDFFIIFP